MLLLLVLNVGSASAHNFACHCMNGSACAANGFCVAGCALGWHGPGCQVGNVALGKQASQSTTWIESNYVCSADRAIDGSWPTYYGPVSCSHTLPYYMNTSPKASAWWAVTLDAANYYFISNVTLVNRIGSYGRRLTNFTILYSNETEIVPDPSSSAWQECARENGIVEYNKTYTCNNVAIAKRLAVYIMASYPYNPESILTLCEVEIYGYQHYDCPSGFTGPGCLLRACNQCENTSAQCSEDFHSCNYDVCPDPWLLPPDCWISALTLTGFSGLSIQSTATCNSLMFSTTLLTSSQGNIAPSLLQLQVKTSTDHNVLQNATLLVQTSTPTYYNFSSATADTNYSISAKILYCNGTGSSCFYTSESKIFSLWTGKREYVFSRTNSCIFINVSSPNPYCEMPSIVQVACDEQEQSRVTINSSSFRTCVIERDRGYNCSINAYINDKTTERRSSYIVPEPLSALRTSEENVAVVAGSIGGSIVILVVVVAIVAVLCRRLSTHGLFQRQQNAEVKSHALAIAPDASQIYDETYGTQNATNDTKEPCENIYESLNKDLQLHITGDYASLQ